MMALDPNIIPPDQSPVSLEQLIGSLRAYGVYASETTEGMRREVDTAFVAGQNTVDAIQRGADSRGRTAAGIQQEGLARMESQQAAQQFARAAGIDATDPASLAVAMGAKLRQDFEQAIALDKVVTEKESLGFFDSPIRFLMNQLTLPGDIGKYNAAASQFNKTAAGLTELKAQAQSAVQTQKMLEQTVTIETIAADLEAQRADIDARAADAQRLMHTTNASNLRMLWEMDSKQLEAEMNIYKLLGEEERWQWQKRMQTEQLALSRAAATRAAAGDKDNAAELSRLSQAYVEGYKKLHGVEPPAFNPKDLKLLYSSKGTLGEKTRTYIDRGLLSMFDPTNPLNNKYGYDAASAAGTLLATTPTLSPEIEKTKRLIIDPAVAAARSTKGLKPDQLEAAINAQAEATLRKYATNMDLEPDNNPLRAPPLESMPLISKAVTQSKWWKTVVTPQIATQPATGPVNHQQLVDWTQAAVKQKQISATEAAAGIKSWAAAVTSYNTKSKLERLGLPPQTSYPVRIETRKPAWEAMTPAGALLSTGKNKLDLDGAVKTYDLTKDTDVKELLLK